MKASRATRFVPIALCALLAAGVASGARAQSGGAQTLLDGKVVGSIGGFVLGTDVKARLNGETTSNPDVDFDKTFGDGGDHTRIRGDLLWRVTPTHHFRFLYFDNSSSSKRVLDQDVAFGNYVFNAGSQVKATTSFKVAELAYEYAFIRQPTFELNGSVGVHWMDVSLKLRGDATVTDSDGNVTQVSGSTKKGSASAPLPVVGVRAAWVVHPQVYLDAQAQYFKAKIDNVNGSVVDLRAGATWMFSQNFGVGVGYNHFKTNVKIEKNDFDGRLRLGYSGLQVFLTGAF